MSAQKEELIKHSLATLKDNKTETQADPYIAELLCAEGAFDTALSIC